MVEMISRPLDRRMPTTTPTIDELAMITSLAAGRSVKEIAASTGRHPNTIYDHLSRLRGRFGLHTDVELVAFAIRHRWIP